MLAGAWLVLVVYAYPGQLVTDSFEHLGEARAHLYTDGHPPIIAALWHFVELFIAGPFGMLAIQSIGFLAGLHLTLTRTFAPRRAAWITAAIFLYPPVFVTFAVVWKDCLMAAALMLAIAGLTSTRRNAQLAALAAIWAATAFRYNAVGATFPLVLALFVLRAGRSRLERYASAAGVWLVLTLAAFGANALLTDRHMYYWSSSLGPFDIVGTLAHVHPDLPDAQLEQLLAGTQLLVHDKIHARMRAVYDPDHSDPALVKSSTPLWQLPISGYEPAPKAQRDAIGRAWTETVTTWPSAYLRHRLGIMGQVLSITRHRPKKALTLRDFDSFDLAHSLGISTTWSATQRKLTHLVSFVLRRTPLFLPWLYLVIGLLLLPWTRRHRDVFALLASGLGLEATLVPLAPTADYRYSHWMIVATVIAAVILVARRARERAAPPAPPTGLLPQPPPHAYKGM